MPADLPELPVTFRPTRTRAVLLTLGVGLLAAFVAIAVMLPADGARPWHTTDRLWMVLTGVLIAAVLVLLSRPKVVADRDGVTVVNLTTRRRLEWAQVIRVNLRPGDPWVFLDLADGTSLAAMGIQPGIGRARALRDARGLRALAEVHGSGRIAGR
ncbi:PH domain-containing protein [Streptomyces sp. MI02-7b]|uniref:PH domain-containing protein n=1 Tax=Streptomyces sp. MI02-7b TaxID=462941 RepID=UPI0029B751F9|nr:PH domain-containing protein [Streptomyces sp. MI02-7b]MDX3077154.1 PH domain-containing protein [Streptomyces sp. MI02-7b]